MLRRARRLSPIAGAIGPEGNSRLELVRSSSAVFNILLEDESQYDDSFLGMNGRIHINPLPANITIAVPSELTHQVWNCQISRPRGCRGAILFPIWSR